MLPRWYSPPSYFKGNNGLATSLWRHRIYSGELCTESVCPLVLYSSGNWDWRNKFGMGDQDCPKNSKRRKDKGDQTKMNFEYMLSSGLGTVFYTLCVFALGGWIGRPMACWLHNMMPWKNCDKCNK